MKKIPRLIELKEENNPKYTSESIKFQDLVQTLNGNADLAFNMVDTTMKQIRAMQIRCIAIILSNATDEGYIKMIRIDLGDCLNRIFNLPRVRNDIQAVLSGKIGFLDSTRNMKARLKAAMLCLIHVEKFNFSNKLPH